jgi:4-oxalocrotonate tautomerase
MPMIRVELFEGRSVEHKRALARALTEAVVQTLGGQPESVHIVFQDVARHDWATGGTLWSEREAAPPPVDAAAAR